MDKIKFIKIANKFIEIWKDAYNPHKIELDLNVSLSEYEYTCYLVVDEYTTYCEYSKANGLVKLSEETQIIFEKKLNKKLFTEFVEYVDLNGLTDK